MIFQTTVEVKAVNVGKRASWIFGPKLTSFSFCNFSGQSSRIGRWPGARTAGKCEYLEVNYLFQLHSILTVLQKTHTRSEQAPGHRLCCAVTCHLNTAKHFSPFCLKAFACVFKHHGISDLWHFDPCMFCTSGISKWNLWHQILNALSKVHWSLSSTQ